MGFFGQHNVRMRFFPLHVINHPWLFLRSWAPEIAERNWVRVVDFTERIISFAGEDKISELYLHLEGLEPNKEKTWLFDYAKRLPDIKVHSA